MLVGGHGTRLRPLTLTTPKPMLPCAGVPLLTHLLSKARAAGLDHVILSTSYLPEVFVGHFGDGSALGLELEYVTEVEPLGTGGGIAHVADRLRGGPVVVFNGDVLAGLDIGQLLARHLDSEADVTLHLTRVADPRAFGVVPTDADGRVTAFVEKSPQPATDQVNAGCYVFRPQLIRQIPTGRAVSVEREVFPALVAGGARVVSQLDTSYWLDVGTPTAFVTGSCDLVRGLVASAALPGAPGESLRLPGSQVSDGATLVAGTVVGTGCVVGDRALLDGAVLFDGARVGADAVIRRCILGRDAAVGEASVLDGVVLGDGATVGAGNELRYGARVWPGVALPDGSVRFSP